jgi:integrase
VRKFDVTAAIRAGGNKRHAVGNGLSLYVRGNSALWVYQYRDRFTKRLRQTSLGSAKGFEAMTISQARDARDRYRVSLLDGTAPARRTPTGKTFGDALLTYLDTRASAWTGGIEGAEADAHRRLLELDFAKLPLSQIDTDAIRAVLAPWHGRRNSVKLRTKINSVIDFAKASRWFTGDNPAARATMGKLLPKVRKAKPHESMPWRELPAFMRELAAFDTPASRALRFTIHCAARSSETRFATWSEIQGDVWSIAGERMKEGVAHVVPLSDEALALLAPCGRSDDLIFAGPNGKALGGNAMMDHVRDRGYSVHGFRSTFVDWAAENDYSSELRELALAHAVGDQVERAYRRTGMVDQRRPMMQAFAAFATSKTARPLAVEQPRDGPARSVGLYRPPSPRASWRWLKGARRTTRSFRYGVKRHLDRSACAEKRRPVGRQGYGDAGRAPAWLYTPFQVVHSRALVSAFLEPQLPYFQS